MADGDLRSRRAVAEMDRVALEDKHLRLMEENMILKKHARSQEDKMKRMATKLLRLTADEKKEARKDTQSLTAAQLRQRDIETEEMMDELQSRIREMEKQNSSLKNKVLVLKQQVDMKGKRHTPYDHIQSKISSGVPRRSAGKPPTHVYSEESVPKRVTSKPLVMHNASTATCVIQPSSSCHNLLEEVRRDNQELEDQVLQLKAELLDMETENQSNKEMLRLRSLQLEEEKLMCKQELRTHLEAIQHDKTDQEMEVMKAQREYRDASNRLHAMTTRCTAAEKNLEILKVTHTRVLTEMERLNEGLKDERGAVTRLEVKLRSHESDRQTISNLEEMVGDMRRERDALREAGRDLSHRDEVYTAKHKAKIKSLQEEIKILEEAARKENRDRSNTLKELAVERELSVGLDGELRGLRVTYQKLKQEYDKLQEKLKFYEKESSLDWTEVEEALAVVKEGRGVVNSTHAGTSNDDLQELSELKVWHADTINELEKTRKLLQMQHVISKDYKAEVELSKCQLTELQQHHEAQLQEYAELVDIKSARVKKLEGQLKEIAYGTRPYRLDTSKFESGGRRGEEEEGEGLVELERGQNLLQFNISRVSLSPDALSSLSTNSPALFITFNFSDYETQVTPVLQGPKPNFGYTASFIITVDDVFLQHLQKSSIRLELNRAMGFKYQTLAVASVKCWEAVTTSGVKVHGKAALTGVGSMEECVGVGSMEYWMRLKQPIAQTTKLYQDRSKALALMDSLQAAPTTGPTPLPPPSQGPDYNELSITVIKCQGLPTKDPIHFPSPYVMYKFYSFPDHDTPISINSTSPNFMDAKTFPLSMNSPLDQYLRTEKLELYVFNDDEVEGVESGYIGLAHVAMAPLSQGKPINGTFHLKQASGESSGFLELSIKWKLLYDIQRDPLPPSKSLPPPPPKSTPPPISTVPHTPSSKSTPSTSPLPSKSVPPAPSLPLPSGIGDDRFLVHPTHGHNQASGRLARPEKNVVSSLQSSGSDNNEMAELKNSLPPLRRVVVGGKEKDEEEVSSVANSGLVSKGKVQSLEQKSKGKVPSLQSLDQKSDIKSTENLIRTSSLKGDVDAEGVASGNHGNMDWDLSSGSISEILDSEGEVAVMLGGGGGGGGDGEPSGVGGAGGVSRPSGLSEAAGGPVVSSKTDLLTDVSGSGISMESGVTPLQPPPQPQPEFKVIHVGGGGGGGGEGDSISMVSVTELSDDGEDDESIEEEMEDTMFEETLLDDLSGLSEHSSDRPHPQSVFPESHLVPESRGVSDLEHTLSDVDSVMENSNPITLVSKQQPLREVHSNIEKKPHEVHSKSEKPPHEPMDGRSTMSITILSFTLESGCSLADDDTVKNVFVEYQFLNFDYGELETPSSLPKPLEGETVHFNFTKVFHLDEEQLGLLGDRMKPGDPTEGKIGFTLVCDPEDPDADCNELGTATVDLHWILERKENINYESIDVITPEDDPEVIGYITVTVQALDLFQKLLGATNS